MPLAASLLAVAAALGGAAVAGWMAAASFLPRGRAFRGERLAWGFAVGLLLLALPVPIAFSVGWRPGLAAHLLCAAIVVAATFRSRIRGFGLPAPLPDFETQSSKLETWMSLGLVGLCALGISVYALEALTEPMWSLDFIAIWGLKGKVIFSLRALPEVLFRDPDWAFAHPEYPLGLPLVYAGLAFLVGRWDDHAMALLFPCLQVATLLAVFGWLRRRGAARAVAMGAAALLALFSPLYSAFLTGVADIPLSFVVLLLGTALSDAIDETDPGAVRRLALASVLAVGTKNEGLFFVVVALALVLVSLRGERRRQAAAALLLPAAILLVLHRFASGGAALRDFDLGFLRPAHWGALSGRLVGALGVAAREVAWPAWPVLAAILALFLAGRRAAFADRLLMLAGAAAVVYVLLPGLAVLPGEPDLGPAWLVRTALARTCAALAPLVAAGLAARLADGAMPRGASTGSAASPTASAGSR